MFTIISATVGVPPWIFATAMICDTALGMAGISGYLYLHAH